MVWWPDGSKWREGEYANARRHGKWTAWWPNGKKMYEVTYRNGLLIGDATIWYRNGQKKAEGAYTFSKLHGIWKAWQEDGTEVGKLMFDAGNVPPRSPGNPEVVKYLPKRLHFGRMQKARARASTLQNVGKELSSLGRSKIPSKLRDKKREGFVKQSEWLLDTGKTLRLYASAIELVDEDIRSGVQIGIVGETDYVLSSLEKRIRKASRSSGKFRKTSASANARHAMASSALRRLKKK